MDTLPTISSPLGRIGPSRILAIAAECRRRKALGEQIIDLSLGEPDFATPEHVGAAAARAIAEGQTRYTSVSGIAPLKVALRSHFAKEGITYGPRELMVTAGATGALWCALKALLMPMDEALIPIPFYPAYPNQISLAGGVPVPVVTDHAHGFKLTPEALRAAITSRTRVLVLNNPCNPTGAVYSLEELRALATVVLENRLFVISDEVYCSLVYGEPPYVSFARISPEVREQTLVVRSVSKTYAMTGWRIGFAAGPEELIEGMTQVQELCMVMPASVSQWAALEALRASQECVSSMVSDFAARHRYVCLRLRAIADIQCIPSRGGFFVFPDLSRRTDDVTDLCARLLKRDALAVVPGKEFGMPSCVRLSFACSTNQLTEGLNRLERALYSLDKIDHGSRD